MNDDDAAKCRLPETRQLLVKLEEWLSQNRPWNPAAFAKESRASFFAVSAKVQSEKFDRSLNEIAYALLFPPNSALRSAALQDFQYATRLSERDVVQYLFTTTAAHPIQVGTDAGNVAEQRALERIGFQREGVLRGVAFRGGQWRYGIMYSLLRDDRLEPPP